MPKHRTIEVLTRLRHLDAALHAQGAVISEFARAKKVTEKTVRRDLELLEKLAREWLKATTLDGDERRKAEEREVYRPWHGDGEREWRYEKWVQPVFARNM